MTTLFYRPTSSFDQLFRQIDELLEGAAQTVAPAQPAEAPHWKPRAAIQELDNRYEVRFQLPGIDPAALEIEASRDLLTIKGERPAPTETPLHSEFRYGKFERHFRLPEEIQQENVSATYVQGLLTLVLPKLTAAENYSVKVAIATSAQPATLEAANSAPAEQPAAEQSPKASEQSVEPSAESAVEPEPVW